MHVFTGVTDKQTRKPQHFVIVFAGMALESEILILFGSHLLFESVTVASESKWSTECLCGLDYSSRLVC